jgi:DNA invertase Pin-like site-specific DNA recombinase
MSFAEASVAEPLSCVLNGQEQARVGGGQTVVVVGAGPTGCLHVRLARARGAARVLLIELNPWRLELAAGLVAPDEAIAADGTGNVEAVRTLTEGGGADVVIVAAGSGKAQEDALRMAARRGTVSFFGGLPKDARPSPATPTSSTTGRSASSAPTAPAPTTINLSTCYTVLLPDSTIPEGNMDVGYARVSSLDQDPQLQINALERAGAWPIVQEKVSGVAKARPVRDEVLRMAKPGDTITVWKLDRWGRSVTDLLEVIDNLVQRGVRFRVLTQPIDTSSAFGRMQLTLLAAFAEFERSLIIERTMAGRQRRLDEGKHPGGPALYGFKKDHVTVIESEARLLREGAKRVLEGEPLNRIVDDWNKRGLRTRAGSRWQVKTLRRILANPWVVPILGEDTARELIRIFNQPDRQRLGRPADHLLSGILSCSRCEQPMYGIRTQQRDGTKRPVYVCRKAGAGGRFAGCGSMVIGMDRVDAWAEEAFIAAVVSDDFAQALDRRQAELLAGEVTAQDLDDWRREIEELELVMPTRFGTPDMKRRHDDLRRMVDQATARLLAQPDLQALVDLPKSESKLRARWAAWTMAEQRVWLRRLVERIEVKPATTRGRGSDVESRLKPVWKF